MKSKRPSRKIVVSENDDVVYEGDDRRFYDRDHNYQKYNSPQVLGMFTLKEVVQFVIFVVPIIAFIIQSNARQESIEKAYLYLTEYSVNADKWQSIIYRTEFKQGKPLNDAFVENIIKESLQRGQRR